MDQRLKGQEVSIRIVQNDTTIAEINTISTFNEEVALRLLEAGYLGETTNRFDEILDGYGGDMEIAISKANWVLLQGAVTDRAQRKTIGTVFNVVRTDLFANGDSNVYIYTDVNWGPMPSNVASRGDYVKPKLQFKCSSRPVSTNSIF